MFGAEDMSLERFYLDWQRAKTQGHPDIQQVIKEALHDLSTGKPNWDWFLEGLKDEQKRWFIAALFRKAPVPKRLLRPMLATAVDVDCPSSNAQFVKPCVNSLGAWAVLSFLKSTLETEPEDTQTGAVRARYWVRDNPRSENLDVIRQELHDLMIDRFLTTDHVPLQRGIIAQLNLRGNCDGYRRQAVIDRARSSSDAYVRHRIEVQLGETRGPFLSITS
jgi:hypothetical protein